MAVALAQILPRFGTGESAARARSADSPRPIEELVAEGERRGRAEATAAAQAEIAAICQKAEAEADRRIEEARRQWTEAESARLAQELSAAVVEVETRLARSAARALAPFLSAAIRTRAIAELAERIAELRSDGDEPLFRISGPDDLLARLRTQPALAAVAAEFVAGVAPEVKVTLDETVIETQLAAWSARLSEALNDG